MRTTWKVLLSSGVLFTATSVFANQAAQSQSYSGKGVSKYAGKGQTYQVAAKAPTYQYAGQDQNSYYGQDQNSYYGQDQAGYYGQDQESYYDQGQTSYYDQGQTSYYDQGQSQYDQGYSYYDQDGSVRTLPQGVSQLRSGHVYSLVSRNSGKCMDVVDHSYSSGAEIQQWSCHYQENQRFMATRLYGNAWVFTAVESRMPLQIEPGFYGDGALLVQGGNYFGNSGYFTVRPTYQRGVFTIRTNQGNKCLDVQDVSRYDGARIQQWSCTGRANQEWIFVERRY